VLAASKTAALRLLVRGGPTATPLLILCSEATSGGGAYEARQADEELGRSTAESRSQSPRSAPRLHVMTDALASRTRSDGEPNRALAGGGELVLAHSTASAHARSTTSLSKRLPPQQRQPSSATPCL
jgi:hypothetical protein